MSGSIKCDILREHTSLTFDYLAGPTQAEFKIILYAVSVQVVLDIVYDILVVLNIAVSRKCYA